MCFLHRKQISLTDPFIKLIIDDGTQLATKTEIGPTSALSRCEQPRV